MKRKIGIYQVIRLFVNFNLAAARTLPESKLGGKIKIYRVIMTLIIARNSYLR